jgi:sodium-coupled monocarboxylate transporter 8/12
LNLSPDPTVRHTLWTQMIGGVFTYCSLYAVNQVTRGFLRSIRV